jgi:hypothetical protein
MANVLKLHYFYGVAVKRTKDGLIVSQEKYVLELIECMHSTMQIVVNTG